MTDDAALKLAMRIARRDRSRREQIDSKLRDEAWREVAEFAAYCCQCRALGLKPWESPPCMVSEDDADERRPNNLRRENDARALLRRMLAAGVSRWQPDPMAALGA